MNFQFNNENIKYEHEKSKKNRVDLGLIINPFFDKYELSKKEILEVCQIGKFIHTVDNEILIVDKPKPPNPDFIIKHKSVLIGLEHTRILTENADRYLKIKTLLDNTEGIFKKRYPNEKVHVTISIQNDRLDYTLNEKSKLAGEIADMVQWTRVGKIFDLPKYITRLKTCRHSQVSFSYIEKNWQAEYLTKERLKEEVWKKENKIPIYKTSTREFSEYWLVLLIGSLSSVSYKLNESVDYSITSIFERVYLMADFDAKVIRVA